MLVAPPLEHIRVLLMNPDNNDPKNHAPPVSPGDAWGDIWGDLNHVPSSEQTELPQKMKERGIPTKRELNHPSALRSAPNFDQRSDGWDASTEPLAGGSASARKAAHKAVNRQSKRLVSSLARSLAIVPPKKPPALIAKITGDTDSAGSPANDLVSNETLEADLQEDQITRMVSTPNRGNKHFRVNEINAQRRDDKWLSKTPPKISKRAGKTGFNAALMQSSRPNRKHAGAAGVKGFSFSFVWIAGTGAGVILIVVAAIFLNYGGRVGGAPGEQSGFGNITPERIHKDVGFKGGKVLDSLINGEKRAKGIFATYATSKSVGNFIGMVYKAEKNGEIIAGRWKSLGMVPEWKPDDNCRWLVMEEGGIEFGVLSGFLADSSSFRAVFRLEGDSMKMDWKATTGYCSADYPELKQGLGDGLEIRAILSPGDFHTFALSEDEYRCFTLLAPDRQETVWGYTRLNGADDVLLHTQFLPNQLTGEMWTEVPVLLVLERGRTETLPNQWMISKVVRLSWLDE
jgi:hypothetical protein